MSGYTTHIPNITYSRNRLSAHKSAALKLGVIRGDKGVIRAFFLQFSMVLRSFSHLLIETWVEVKRNVAVLLEQVDVESEAHSLF